MFAIALWDARRRRLRAGPRPLRDQAALLPAPPAATLSFASELKALLRAARLLARDRPAGARRLPRLQLDPGAADDLRRGAQAARRRTCSSGRAGEPTVRRYARPRPGRRRRACATRPDGALAAELREALRDSVRAHLVADVPVGVLLSGGVDSARLTALAAEESGEPVQHLLDRLRGGELRRARAGAAGRRALRHRPPRAGPAPRRGRAAAEAGRGLRRAVRRLLGAADLPRLRARGRRRSRSRSPARAATSSSAATTPTSPTCSPRGSAASRRSPRPLVERLPSSDAQGQLRLQGEALRRGPRACRRWSATTAGRRSSPPRRGPRCSADGARLGPARPLPRALRRDRGRRAARAAPGRRPRHLPGRRPAGEDRPRQHGPLAGGCGCPSSTRRSPSSRWRCRRRSRSAASPRSGCCAGPWRRCCRARSCDGRKQGFSIPLAAWLRGPLRGFAREVLSPATLRAPGLPRPGRGDAGCSTATSPAARTSAGRSGACWRSHSGSTATASAGPAGSARAHRRARHLDALLAFLVAGVLAWLLVPLTERAGAPGRRDRPTQRALACTRSPTPKLGGLAILVGGAGRGLHLAPLGRRDARDPRRRGR